jgi:hypothetical protein
MYYLKHHLGNLIHKGTEKECELIVKAFVAYGEREDKFEITADEEGPENTPNIADLMVYRNLIEKEISQLKKEIEHYLGSPEEYRDRLASLEGAVLAYQERYERVCHFIREEMKP